MVQTVIGINSSMMGRPKSRKKQMKDYKKELQEIISQIDTVKIRPERTPGNGRICVGSLEDVAVTLQPGLESDFCEETRCTYSISR